MRDEMLRDYLAAIDRGHDHRLKTGSIRIREDRRTTWNLGFQPFDIVSQPLSEGQTLIAMTNYFDPAIHLMRVEFEARVVRESLRPARFLVFNEAATIRGVQDGDAYRRMFFRNIDNVKGTNRIDTVNFDASGLWISRNALREMLLIHLPIEGQKKWRYSELIQFPEDERRDSWILCRRWVEDDLLCLEGTRDDQHLTMVSYRFNGGTIEQECLVDLDSDGDEMPPSVHGFTTHPKNENEYWFITRRKAPPRKRGIWRWNERRGWTHMVRKIWGSGLAFLANGDLLVARYGPDDPGIFDGIPGAMIHVPAAMLRD